MNRVYMVICMHIFLAIRNIIFSVKVYTLKNIRNSRLERKWSFF
jgi:hypothetical protein